MRACACTLAHQARSASCTRKPAHRAGGDAPFPCTLRMVALSRPCWRCAALCMQQAWVQGGSTGTLYKRAHTLTYTHPHPRASSLPRRGRVRVHMLEAVRKEVRAVWPWAAGRPLARAAHVAAEPRPQGSLRRHHKDGTWAGSTSHNTHNHTYTHALMRTFLHTHTHARVKVWLPPQAHAHAAPRAHLRGVLEVKERALPLHCLLAWARSSSSSSSWAATRGSRLRARAAGCCSTLGVPSSSPSQRRRCGCCGRHHRGGWRRRASAWRVRVLHAHVLAACAGGRGRGGDRRSGCRSHAAAQAGAALVQWEIVEVRGGFCAGTAPAAVCLRGRLRRQHTFHRTVGH